MTTSASPREVFSIRLGSLGWPNRLRPRVRAHCLQVPTHHHGVPVIDRRFVRFAHRVGMPVHVWTINSRDEMHRLLDVDVDGLMTDDLDVLAAVFAERGLPLSGIPAQLGSGGAVAAPKGSHR